MEAAQEGHIDIVKYLLDRGVCMVCGVRVCMHVRAC